MITNEGNVFISCNKLIKLHLNGKPADHSHLIPVYLNESWLLHFGFERYQTRYYLDISKALTLISQREGDSYIFFLEREVMLDQVIEIELGQIRWVHDLQNMVTLLTQIDRC